MPTQTDCPECGGSVYTNAGRVGKKDNCLDPNCTNGKIQVYTESEMQKAVADKQEACAVVCEKILKDEQYEYADPEYRYGLTQCAEAIRKTEGPTKSETCPHCKFMEELFKDEEIKNNREYWIMTEIFVHLHNGHDYCDWRNNG